MMESDKPDSRVVASTDAPLHKIVFVRAENRYLARPSYPIVSRGNRVRFINHTGDTVDLDFRRPDLFGVATLRLLNGQRETLTVGDLPNDHYPYDGVSSLRGDRLIGESNPEIIIDD